MERRKVFDWILLLLIAAPLLLSAPLALLQLDPVRSNYEWMGIPEGIMSVLGILHILAGVSLFSLKTYKIGLVYATVFAVIIFILKLIAGVPERGIEEVVAVILCVVVWRRGHPTE